MTQFFRGAFIVWIALRYGLDELVLNSFRHPWLRLVARIVSVGRNLRAPRGERLREALEALKADHKFLKQGDVFTDDMIESYMELKWEEVYAYEHTPHPIEFQMYYSV